MADLCRTHVSHTPLCLSRSYHAVYAHAHAFQMRRTPMQQIALRRMVYETSRPTGALLSLQSFRPVRRIY